MTLAYYIYLTVCIIILFYISIQLYRRKNIQYWKPPVISCIKKLNEPRCILYTSYNESYKNKPFVELNSQILQKYANIHGHEYKRIIHDDGFMSYYWTRVYDLMTLLEQTPDDTIIVYLDADAVPNDMYKNISINCFLNSVDYIKNKKGQFYVSEDPLTKYDLVYQGIFNSGVFMVRNNSSTRTIVKEWMNMYNSGHEWVNEGNSWKCKIKDKECAWSFEGYEQYALTKLYQKYPDSFTRLHWSTMACERRQKSCFIIHLMGQSNHQREVLFKKILDNYEHN